MSKDDMSPDSALRPAPSPLPAPTARTPEKFEQLLRTADPAMRRLAYRLVGDQVDDVLQAAYLAAFQNWSEFRGASTFDTWLYRIVYNRCLNHLRDRQRGGPAMSLDSHVAQLAVPAAADPAVIGTARADLAQALSSLPLDQRAAVLLVDADGLTYSEAAQALDLPIGTVASRVSRARQALRLHLQESPQ